MTDQDLEIIASKIVSRLMSPRWMTLKQAVAYSNIGKARLIEMVKDKTIRGFQDKTIKTNAWRIDKQSIDSYMGSQVIDDNEDNNKFALDLLATVDI